MTEFRVKCVTGLQIPVWLFLWIGMEWRHWCVVGFGVVGVIWGHLWLRLQDRARLAVCGSLELWC